MLAGFLGRRFTKPLFYGPYCTLEAFKYVQGQRVENVREYFYFIDHQGQLFLDDSKMKNFTSCFKERDFLRFFFKRVKPNNGRYSEFFPFVSPCGPEMNYLRCDDLPLVFTQLLSNQDADTMFSYNNAGDLLQTPFRPETVCMLPASGRVYHAAPHKQGGVGLVRSTLAIQFSKHFEFENECTFSESPPTHFNWAGRRYELTNELLPLLESLKSGCHGNHRVS